MRLRAALAITLVGAGCASSTDQPDQNTNNSDGGSSQLDASSNDAFFEGPWSDSVVTDAAQVDATAPETGTLDDGGLADVTAADDGPADTSAGEPTPPKPPYDWVGVVGTGQSLSIGWTSKAMSTAQPFKNLKLVDTGPDPKYPISADAGAPKWATVPLVEPIRGNSPGSGPGYGDGQYPDNIFGETPHSGMANTLSALWTARGGQGDYVTAHSVVGWSGHCLVDINKEGGQRAYPASINEARVWKDLATAASKTFGYGGVILTHGECDTGNPAYGAGLYQLWQDYNADLKAITGQALDIVLFASQQSANPGGAGGSPVQVWQAGMAHPGQIVCTGPKYQYQYQSDNLHFPAPGYERLGQKYAEVFDLVVNQGVAWKPLQPNKVTRAGADITVAFDVPNPPLVWDSHITPPHQTANTEWAAGKGFEVKNGSGSNLEIAQVAIQGTSVVITLSTDPGPGKVTVGYALTRDGGAILRGLLRDSDEFTGWDAETVEAQLKNGSAVATSAMANGFLHRAGYDIVTGAGVPADTVVLTHDSDGQITLSAPWSGPSGKVSLSFRHDERNFCVHFSMSEM